MFSLRLDAAIVVIVVGVFVTVVFVADGVASAVVDIVAADPVVVAVVATVIVIENLRTGVRRVVDGACRWVGPVVVVVIIVVVLNVTTAVMLVSVLSLRFVVVELIVLNKYYCWQP